MLQLCFITIFVCFSLRHHYVYKKHGVLLYINTISLSLVEISNWRRGVCANWLGARDWGWAGAVHALGRAVAWCEGRLAVRGRLEEFLSV